MGYIVDPHFLHVFPFDGKTRFLFEKLIFKNYFWNRHLIFLLFLNEKKNCKCDSYKGKVGLRKSSQSLRVRLFIGNIP